MKTTKYKDEIKSVLEALEGLRTRLQGGERGGAIMGQLSALMDTNADHGAMAERGDCHMIPSDFYSSLCTKDKRSPYFEDIYGDEEDIPVPRKGCHCDNCFYGRDRLALVIIELLERK